MESNSSVQTMFLKHFQFLARTKDDQSLLDSLARRVRSISQKPDEWLVTIHSKKIDEEKVLVCARPFDGPAHPATPRSLVELARVHNGITTAVLGGGVEGFFGLDQEGRVFSGPWRAANNDLLSLSISWAVRLRELGIERIDTPFEYNRRWLVIDPTRKNEADEPALSYVRPARPVPEDH